MADPEQISNTDEQRELARSALSRALASTTIISDVLVGLRDDNTRWAAEAVDDGDHAAYDLAVNSWQKALGNLRDLDLIRQGLVARRRAIDNGFSGHVETLANIERRTLEATTADMPAEG